MITVTTKGKNHSRFVMVDQFDDSTQEAYRFNDVDSFGETQYTVGRWQPKGFKNASA